MKKVLDVILGFLEGAFFTGVILLSVFFIYNLLRSDKQEVKYDTVITGVMEDGAFRVVTESSDEAETAECWVTHNGTLHCRKAYISQYSGKQKFVWEFDTMNDGEDIVCVEVYSPSGDFLRVDIFQVTKDPDKGVTYSLYQEKSPALLEQIHSTMQQIT